MALTCQPTPLHFTIFTSLTPRRLELASDGLQEFALGLDHGLVVHRLPLEEANDTVVDLLVDENLPGHPQLGPQDALHQVTAVAEGMELAALVEEVVTDEGHVLLDRGEGDDEVQHTPLQPQELLCELVLGLDLVADLGNTRLTLRSTPMFMNTLSPPRAPPIPSHRNSGSK